MPGAAGDGARDTQCAHHRFRAGVAQTRAVEAGHVADLLRDVAGERVLRADFIAGIELLAYAIENPIRLPAEHAHAEAVERVDVLIAVEIPHA